MNSSWTKRIGILLAAAATVQLWGCSGERVPEVTPKANAAATSSQPAVPPQVAATPQASPSTADATLSSKVESALKAEPDLHGVPIAVRSKDGIVTLSGAAKDPQLRSMAAQVALSIDGVKLVRNEIALAQDA